MFSRKHFFIYWLISVVVSVGLPVAAVTLSGFARPGSCAGTLVNAESSTPSQSCPPGQAPTPETSTGIAVSPPPVLLASPPDKSGVKGRVLPAIRPDDPLVEKDVSRPVSLVGDGGYIHIVSGNPPITTADGRAVTPISVQRWNVKTSDKVIAITFDDGPSVPVTSRILDVLERYGAKATFFVVGDIAERQPALLERMVREGHEIGNHGYSHRTDHSSSLPRYIEEMEKTRNLIERLCGAITRWYRPNSMRAPAAMLIAAQKTGHGVSLWSIDTRDWSNVSVSQIVASIDPEHIQPGAVVLFHDGGGNRDRTVKALELVLAALEKRGFTSVTVSELLERRE